MNLVKNIILAICLTLNLGESTRLSVKPSAYLMPEIVFTNQANIDLVKKTKVTRMNPPAISLFRGRDGKIKGKPFQVRMPLPDLASMFLAHHGDKEQGEIVIRNWKIEKRVVQEKLVLKFNYDQLAYRAGR